MSHELRLSMSLAENDKDFKDWRGFRSQLQVKNGNHACTSISVLLAIRFNLLGSFDATSPESLKAILNSSVRAGAALDSVIRCLVGALDQKRCVIGVDHVSFDLYDSWTTTPSNRLVDH